MSSADQPARSNLRRVAVSVLSAALLVPWSGGLLPALAQPRARAVPASVSIQAVPAAVGLAGLAPAGLSLASPRQTAAPTLQALRPAPQAVLSPVLSAPPQAPLTPAQAPLAPAVEAAHAAAAAQVAAAPALGPGLQLIAAARDLPRLAPAPAGRAVPARGRTDRPSALGSASAAAVAGDASAAFDGAGLLPRTKPYHPELGLTPGPAAPASRAAWEKFAIPSRRAVKGGLLGKLLEWVFGPGDAIELPGNPKDETGVERALRRVIADRPELFERLGPGSFGKVLVAKVPGQAGLADSFYANFHQKVDGIAVEGSYLNFVVKVFGGKAFVVSSSAQLYPDLAVDTAAGFDDERLRAKAAERLGTTPADTGLRGIDRKVLHVGGQWRAAQVFIHERLAVMVAVDMATGEAFAWDPRVNARLEAPSAKREGSVAGRGVADGPHAPAVELAVLPLGHIEIEGPAGARLFADENGRFTVPGSGDQPVQLTVRLSGRYARVLDQGGKDLVVTVTAKPGEELRAVFNPRGSDEGFVAQVNAYFHTTLVHDWLAARGLNLGALNRAIPVKVNIDDECNAYYTPYVPSLNFFKSSENCANSSYGDVVYHEYGHFADDAAGGILNGGLSEGWGDIIALFITRQPILGRGFIKEGPQDYLRHGENGYQYGPGDEVHAQGQAWMGFAWKLRKLLIAALGDEARASALVEALVIPVLLAAVRDIPAAIRQVLVHDIGEDGAAPHLKEIQAAAKAHGIDIELPGAGGWGGLFAREGRAGLGPRRRRAAR